MKARQRGCVAGRTWVGRFVVGLVCNVVWSLCSVNVALDAAEPSPPSSPLFRTHYGVTAEGVPLECWLHPEDLDLATKKFRVLVIGGLADDGVTADALRAALNRFYESPTTATCRERIVLSAIPQANPTETGSGPVIERGYPLGSDHFYASNKNPTAAYLWRWVGMHAPDLVVDLRTQPPTTGEPIPSPQEPAWLKKLSERCDGVARTGTTDEFWVQLQRAAPSDTGTIPAIRWSVPAETLRNGKFLESLAEQLLASEPLTPSAARRELQTRLQRTPRQVASQLVRHYGHKLPEPAYIPAFAMIGRLRFGEYAGDHQQRLDVERIVATYRANPQASAFQAGNLQSGHLLFCELADLSEGERRAEYVALAKRVADLAFDEHGQPRESMPNHSEMSDSLFMGGPILAHVGALTGEEKYREACLRHLRFMRRLCLRKDGIYRHSPLDESAWGRGNGFPAIGVALSLSQFSPDHPGHAELREWLRAHLTALLAHQDRTGAWHQVIDHPESYRELTATCMIGFAMARGVRRGWLDEATFQPAIDRAWYAVRTRVAADGRLVDVCTGTGKQKSLRDYYDRAAILGRDDRGGAMALLFATELSEPER